MQTLEVTLTLETPACLSSAPVLGNETQTLRHIPGSALRGMLAGAYLKGKKADAEFNRLFSEGGLRFGNLTPKGAAVLPRSAYTCKRFPGFVNDPYLPGGQLPHGVLDLLFEPLAPGDRACPKCGHSLEALDAPFYRPEGGKLHSVDIDTITHMRTAINARGGAREGNLYTREEIAAGTNFHGYLHSQDGEAQALLKALKLEFGNDLTVYTGLRRSGKAKVRFGSSSSEPDLPLSYTWSGKTGRWAALTLASDGILVDHLLRPVVWLDSGRLKAYLGLPAGEEVEVVQSFVARRQAIGWSGVGKLYRPDDLALAAGSTFLLHFPQGETQGIKTWQGNLQANGIGLRRAEGFGQVTFTDPLHGQVFGDHQGRNMR